MVIAAFALAQLARDAGKALEAPLWKDWGGPPTARMLRHSDPTFEPPVKATIHSQLVRLSACERMPTSDEEKADTESAEAVYRLCGDWLRRKALQLKNVSPFDVVHQENVNYGYHRNILGIADAAGYVTEAVEKVLNKRGWGVEFFPPIGTSNENEMSVTQFAYLNEKKILLTADTGRDGLQEIIDYAPYVGLQLPGIDKFQVPHHGGRHNVTSELLDTILGPKLDDKPTSFRFTAVISASDEDPDHPRKSVERALWHRGAYTLSTEHSHIRTYGGSAPGRGWGAAQPVAYPEEQEEWD